MQMFKVLDRRDRLFLFFLAAAAVIMILFGIASVILVLKTNPSELVTFRIISVFAAMFSGWLGTMTGYLLAISNAPDDIKEKKPDKEKADG